MCVSMMLSKQNTITSDMWADVFSANETYRRTSTPHPPHVHTLGLTCIPPFLIKPWRHTQTPTVTLHFHPGARRASLHHFKHRPASSDGSRLHLSASAKQNFYTEQEKQLQTFMKYTLKRRQDKIGRGHRRGLPFIFSVF